jgi:hypothetical protein
MTAGFHHAARKKQPDQDQQYPGQYKPMRETEVQAAEVVRRNPPHSEKSVP